MKNINILLLTSIAFYLNACNSSSNQNNNTNTKDTAAVLNTNDTSVTIKEDKEPTNLKDSNSYMKTPESKPSQGSNNKTETVNTKKPINSKSNKAANDMYIGDNVPVMADFDLQNNVKTPEFPGGQEALREFIENRLRYPLELESQSISGLSIVNFFVESDGSISNVTIYKTSGYEAFDKEAIRLVKIFPKFKPGRDSKGNPTRTQSSIPIVFELEE